MVLPSVETQRSGIDYSSDDQPVHGLSDPEPVEDPVEAIAAGSEPEFVLEIVETEDLDLGTQPGTRQEPPLESTEPDEPDGSGDLPSAEGDVYTWQDGDRTVGATLQLDLVVLDDGSITPKDEVVANTGRGQIVRGLRRSQPSNGAKPDSAGSSQTGSTQPVFRSESGELMTLPGGVAVVLAPEWDAAAVAAFFARNEIDPSRVSALDYLTNGFVVETDPGFPALDLANSLAGQAGVELSSPNWWRERTTR